ncbi:Alpha/Beta hydrolase protein [Trametes polyzona]|nr:Alpha/Beta hydrolase protein [Trametes polyzona]
MSPPTRNTAEEILLAHAQQLACFDPRQPFSVPRLPPGAPEPQLPADPEQSVRVILDWIHSNQGAIRAAKEAQCASSSPDEPNWDAVLVALIESNAVYLRRDEIDKAILAVHSGDYTSAVAHIQASGRLIRIIAEAMDCTFVQLCDFADKNPEGKRRNSGAYCGLFISNDPKLPYMGIAFKGSDSVADFITDLDWIPIAPLRPEVAWGTQVHQGFYHNLFGDFVVESDVQVPFDVLLTQFYQAYSNSARIHMTGHSLGGALCTLAYGEFLRRELEAPFVEFSLGDLYSFAAPHVCYETFAKEVHARTRADRYAFRFATRQDPVVTVPPPGPPLSIIYPPKRYPFIHVGGGWQFAVGSKPEKLADEPPPVPPMSVDDIAKFWRNHKIDNYYAGWQMTPHS